MESTGKCEELRRIVIYKVLKGKDEVVGKAITDSEDHYKVDKGKVEGRFYAKAPQSVSIGYATQVECEGLRSRTIAASTPTS